MKNPNENENNFDDDDPNVIYFDDELILSYINDTDAHLDADEIGTLNIRTSKCIIVGPLCDLMLEPKKANNIEINYELIHNIKKGKWKISQLSINRDNDVYVIYYHKIPKDFTQVTHKIIKSIKTTCNCIGFYSITDKDLTSYNDVDRLVYHNSTYLNAGVNQKYEVFLDGITINNIDDDFPIFGLPVNAIISEYEGEIFRIILT